MAGRSLPDQTDREREKSSSPTVNFPTRAAVCRGAAKRIRTRQSSRDHHDQSPYWLMSAYAIFGGGGVLVPVDYKLSAAEHLALLDHSQADFLIVEYPFWRAIMQIADFQGQPQSTVFVTEAPPGAELAGARRWEEAIGKDEPEFRSRARRGPPCHSSAPLFGPGLRAHAWQLSEQCRAPPRFSFRAWCALPTSIRATTRSISWLASHLSLGAAVVHAALCARNTCAKPPRYKIHT
jgi:hypothetical protein